MTRFVALLGSINVGGNRLKMADLRGAMEAAGFANVATVTASGNVLFDHDGCADAALQAQLETLLADRFGISSFAAVLTRDALAQATSDNPFAEDGEEKFVHTLFLEKPLDRHRFDGFVADFDGPERVAAGDGMIHVDHAVGVGRSTFDPAFKKAKVTDGRATARNIRSLKRILTRMDD